MVDFIVKLREGPVFILYVSPKWLSIPRIERSVIIAFSDLVEQYILEKFIPSTKSVVDINSSSVDICKSYAVSILQSTWVH